VTPVEAPWPILVAGTITRDDVRTPAGFNRDGLGGSATYCTLAGRLFAPIRVVATAGADFMPVFQAAMAGVGADLQSVGLADEPTYRWRAEHDYETGTTRAETSDQGAYLAFNPTLTPEQRQTPIAFVGSMEPRHQLRVLEQLDHPRLVAGDTMTLYIREQPDLIDRVLRRLDYLFLNAAEALALTQANTIDQASIEIRRRFRKPARRTAGDARARVHLPDRRGDEHPSSGRGPGEQTPIEAHQAPSGFEGCARFWRNLGNSNSSLVMR